MTHRNALILTCPLYPACQLFVAMLRDKRDGGLVLAVHVGAAHPELVYDDPARERLVQQYNRTEMRN